MANQKQEHSLCRFYLLKRPILTFHSTSPLPPLSRLLTPLPTNLHPSLTTAAPSSALTFYSAYGFFISSWWAAHSTEVPEAKEECLNTWEDAKWEVITGKYWLNATIALAECFRGNGRGERLREGVVLGPGLRSGAGRGTVLNGIAVGLGVVVALGLR